MSGFPTGGVLPVGALAATPTSPAPPAGAATGSGSSISAAQAKQVGVAFEQMLVSELAQQLAGTASSSGDASSNGSSTDGTSGLMGSDSASTAYSQMIPDVLTSSIMSTGGTGIAQEIAASLDPALSQPSPPASPETKQ